MQKQNLPQNNNKVEEIYQKVSQIEHVLLRPDTYVGSICATEENMWILDESPDIGVEGSNSFVYQKIQYIPGLYKIFDEILVNAADNYQRDHRMSKIQVEIGNKKGLISVLNDGKTIPIEIHKDHKMYVSELIFGHLLTSSNYKDNEKKVTGGRNGYGAKLTNIFSKEFTVETADSAKKKKMVISWSNNMSDMTEPTVESYSGGGSYTKVSFLPDYQKFGLKKKELPKQMEQLMKKRVYDLAGILKVKSIYLNGEKLAIKSFEDYAALYLQTERQQKQMKLFFPQSISTKRWNVIIGKSSNGQFQQISFVNGINTVKGGTHVNHIVDQIINGLLPHLKKKAKDLSVNLKPFHVRNHLRLFVNCLIENPSFDSQTKETLTTPVSRFGSVFEVTDKMIKEILNSGICDNILSVLRLKENTRIDKSLKKFKNTKFTIPKLEEANLAGDKNEALKCCLILTEGDSAKTLAMSGIQKLKRDYYGIFPLRGKPINARECTKKQVMENQELSNIVKILGLEFGKEYFMEKQKNNMQNLRYGSVMIMTDQDIDGSHIKGLLINFFETFWPSLCKISGFLKEFVTPIIRCKATSASNIRTLDFFSQTDFNKWRCDQQREGGTRGSSSLSVPPSEWKIKYYKGLGTSTHAEAKQYFSNLPKHEIQFRYRDQNDKEAMDLAFNKKLTDQRKKWLQEYDPQINVNYSQKVLKIEDFINKEFIHFSIYDNVRSIPSIVDGLKPSQRKILFSCFKRKLQGEIKVAQLSGYVAQHSLYHHGQMSLNLTIIGMAQNYPTSNNLNLLEPIGQFGTRFLNGKDNASSRYIFTSLNKLTRYLFNEADDHIVEYLEEENQSIEPKYYIPILPLVLINGCEGIGTGWSTTVLPHRVDDVLKCIRKRIQKQSCLLKVSWEGFKGKVTLDKSGSYTVSGQYQLIDEYNSEGQIEEKVVITEIPPNKSISAYKAFLEEKLDSINNSAEPQIEEIREYHKDGNIKFALKFIEGKQPNKADLEKYLKLSSSYKENNMVLFSHDRKLTKYETVQDIIEEFYKVRVEAYRKRKEYLVSRFKRQVEILDNKIRFIQQVIASHSSGNSQFRMMAKKESWIRGLVEGGFKAFGELFKVKSTKIQDYNGEVNNEDSREKMPMSPGVKDFNYLLSIPIWNFCQQKISELESTKKQVSAIVEYYSKVSQIQLWQKDLNEFEEVWNIEKKNKWGSSASDLGDNGARNGKRSRPLSRIEEGIDSQDDENFGEPMSHQRSQLQQVSESSPSNRSARRNRTRNEQIKNKTFSKKNLIQQQVSVGNGSKKVKRVQIDSQEKMSEEAPKNDLDLILNKYLATSSNDGLSFEERIKAKLQSYEKNLGIELEGAEKVADAPSKVEGQIRNVENQEKPSPAENQPTKSKKADRTKKPKSYPNMSNSLDQYDWLLKGENIEEEADKK